MRIGKTQNRAKTPLTTPERMSPATTKYAADPTNPRNTDGTDEPDYLDLDSDNDGYDADVEVAAGTDPYDSYSYPGASIPTVSEWGMIIFFILLVGSAIWVIRRRRRQESS